MLCFLVWFYIFYRGIMSFINFVDIMIIYIFRLVVKVIVFDWFVLFYQDKILFDLLDMIYFFKVQNSRWIVRLNIVLFGFIDFKVG